VKGKDKKGSTGMMMKTKNKKKGNDECIDDRSPKDNFEMGKISHSKIIQSSMRRVKFIAFSTSLLLSIVSLCINNISAVLSYGDTVSTTNTNGTGSPFRTAQNNEPQRTDDTGLIEAIVFFGYRQ
jgi:hypothetical protein